MTIAALILAGGQGSRLGFVDKAFLRLNDRPLLALLLDRLAPQVDRIAISANGDPSRFAAWPLPVLPDPPEHASKGPLAGLAAGLAWAEQIGADTLLTVPVDTPVRATHSARRLEPGRRRRPAMAGTTSSIAHWPVPHLAQRLKPFLALPSAYRVRDALTLCAARQVDFPTAFDPFLNINTISPPPARSQRQGMGSRFFEKSGAKNFCRYAGPGARETSTAQINRVFLLYAGPWALSAPTPMAQHK